jgi:hypothetical protein
VKLRASFLLVARSERSVAIADEPSSTYACFGVYAEQAARARKEGRYDLKKGRFSLQSDEGRVWISGLVSATLWGEGGLLDTRPVAYPTLTRNLNDKAAERRPVRTYSDIEKIWSGRRDSNPRPRPWQERIALSGLVTTSKPPRLLPVVEGTELAKS